MITDLEYQAWLKKTKNTDVVLVDMTTQSSQTLRVSTRKYRTPDNIYRSRLVDFETTREVESGIAGYSVFGVGDLIIVNNDKKLDAWRSLTIQNITVRYGDQSWDIADFRTLQTGAFFSIDVEGDNLRIKLRDEQAKLDKLVDNTDITTTTGLPGALARSVMVESGEFLTGDIDQASFDALDSAYNYPCQITINADGENLASVLDRVLAGFPCDYGIDTDGKVRCYLFTAPALSTVHRAIRPIKKMDIDRVAPYWQVKYSSVDDLWSSVTRTRQPIKDIHPDANVSDVRVSVSSLANATALADDFLDLFNQAFDRCKPETNQSLSGIDMLDEVQINYPQYGYQNGRFGRVMKIADRTKQFSSLEVFCV